MSFATAATGGPGVQLQLGGVPVRFELGFFVVAALLGLGLEEPGLIVLWIAVLTVSVLVHELGHAVAMRMNGLHPRIVLHPFGGLTMGSGRLSRGRSIAVTLAGPLTALLLLGLPAWLVDRSATGLGDTAEALVVFLVWVNVFWSLVNLLPIVPLDGGNVARSLLGARPALILSIGVAGIAGVVAIRAGFFFAGLFAGLLVMENLRELRGPRAGAARHPGDDLRDAVAALREGRYDDARALGRRLRAIDDPRPRQIAAEIEAWAQLAAGDRDGARSTIARLPAGQHPTGHLWFCLREGSVFDVEPTVRAWLDGTALPPPPIYTARLAETGTLSTVTARLRAAGTERAEEALALIDHDLVQLGRPPG